MKNYLIALLVTCAFSSVQAQEINKVEGCIDATGRQVQFISDHSAELLVQTVTTDGLAHIEYNPTKLPRLLPKSKLFLYATECAWLYKGVLRSAERTVEQAAQIDCIALDALKRSRTISSDAEVKILESDLKLSAQEQTLLPTPAHPYQLAQCRQEAARGNTLKGVDSLKTQSASEVWNRCVQGCADKLFRCDTSHGKSGQCQQRYDQCEASCR